MSIFETPARTLAVEMAPKIHYDAADMQLKADRSVEQEIQSVGEDLARATQSRGFIDRPERELRCGASWGWFQLVFFVGARR